MGYRFGIRYIDMAIYHIDVDASAYITRHQAFPLRPEWMRHSRVYKEAPYSLRGEMK